MEHAWHRKPDPEKLLLTGVDGIVGANLALSLAGQFDVLGLFQHHPVSLPGCHTLPWDPADPAAWTDLIFGRKPQWIIHCGPLASSSWDFPEPCPDGEEEARVCEILVKAAQQAGSRLTVITTDAVFAGPRLFHDELAPATSRRPLARAACRAEAVLEGTGALLVRTHAYGWSPAGTRPGFAERVWETLIEGRPAHFHPDRHATPILATTLAELLWAAYRRALIGRYHLAGAERASAYRFAVELAAAFGLRSSDAPSEADPPKRADGDHLQETSLSTRRARRELGRAMPMLRDGLDRFAEQAAAGYRARLQCPVPQPAVTAAAA